MFFLKSDIRSSVMDIHMSAPEFFHCCSVMADQSDGRAESLIQTGVVISRNVLASLTFVTMINKVDFVFAATLNTVSISASTVAAISPFVLIGVTKTL